jgi:hypothetical protein
MDEARRNCELTSPTLDRLLTYPFDPSPIIVEFRDAVLTYPLSPSPATVEVRDVLLT